jgi:hypothetical protein
MSAFLPANVCVFLLLVSCNNQGAAQIVKAIKDLDGHDLETQEKGSRVIYQFSTRRCQPDLIVPVLINHVEQKEKFKATLLPVLSSLVCYGVLSEKYSERAVPAAIDLFDYSDLATRNLAAKFVQTQGKMALPFLLKALKADGREERKTPLLRCLALIGPDASAAIPLLLAELKTRPFAAGAIYETLINIDFADERSGAFFLERLKNEMKPDYLRRAAAQNLARHSKFGKNAIKYLVNDLDKADPFQRTEDLMALWLINDLTPAKRELQKFFDKADDEYERVLSAGMLCRIDIRNDGAFMFLCENKEFVHRMMESADWENRVFAIWVTKALANKGELETLKRLAINDRHKKVREEAAIAVKLFCP